MRTYTLTLRDESWDLVAEALAARSATLRLDSRTETDESMAQLLLSKAERAEILGRVIESKLQDEFGA